MKRYFYLAASLPELSLDMKPPVTFADFLEDAEVYLAKEDLKLVSILKEVIDIENIRRLLLEQKIDDRGNLDEKALDEALLARVNLPPYAIDFLDTYTTTQSRLEHFAQLYAGFFAAHSEHKNRFISQFLDFENELRLWLSLLRAQRNGMDFSQVLQFEDPTNPLIMSMLVQSSNAELILPVEFKELKNIFEAHVNNPLALHKKIEQFRINKISELVQNDLFVIDNILGFLAKLLIIEQWQALNLDQGQDRLNRLSKESRKSST